MKLIAETVMHASFLMTICNRPATRGATGQFPFRNSQKHENAKNFLVEVKQHVAITLHLPENITYLRPWFVTLNCKRVIRQNSNRVIHRCAYYECKYSHFSAVDKTMQSTWNWTAKPAQNKPLYSMQYQLVHRDIWGTNFILWYTMGAIRWGTRETRPLTFSDSRDIICHVPPHFLFRFCNILVSHQSVPPILRQNCAHVVHKQISSGNTTARHSNLWKNVSEEYAFWK